MFSHFVFWRNSRICAGLIKDAMAQCQRERLLLDTTIWIDIAEIIPVRDHSLQGLRAGDRESLKLAVAA